MPEKTNNDKIMKKCEEMKEAKTSFLLKIKSHKEMFTAKYLNRLVPNFKITNLGESSLEGVGRDPLLGLGETVMTVEEGNEKDEHNECYISIYFKLDSQKPEKIVDIFLSLFQEDQKPILLLNSSQEENGESKSILVLPPSKESFDYIMKIDSLKHDSFVGKLSEAGVDWLSFVFNGLDLDTQAKMFGRKAITNNAHGSFQNLIKYITKGGNEMINQRDNLIKMLVELDNKETDKKENGQIRIVKTLKINLESSVELNDWMERVDSKYPIPKTKMWIGIFLAFLSVAAGVGMFSADVGTDWKFTEHMDSLHREFGKNETENNCSEIFDETLEILYKNCHNRADPFDPSNCSANLKAADVALENCFNKEVNRFEDAAKWRDMFMVSIAHMIIPWVLCLLCGLVLAKRTNNWWKIIELLPMIGKLNMFLCEYRINRLLAKEKTNENEKAIMAEKDKSQDLEKSITLVCLQVFLTDGIDLVNSNQNKPAQCYISNLLK